MKITLHNPKSNHSIEIEKPTHWDLSTIRFCNDRTGHYFFSPNTMKAFGSTLFRVHQGEGGVFLTYRDKVKLSSGSHFEWKIRKFDTETMGVEQVADYDTYSQINRLIADDRELCRKFGRELAKGVSPAELLAKYS